MDKSAMKKNKPEWQEVTMVKIVLERLSKEVSKDVESLKEARARALWRSVWLKFKDQEKMQSSWGWDKSWWIGGAWVLAKEVVKCSNLHYILNVEPTKFTNRLIITYEKREEKLSKWCWYLPRWGRLEEEKFWNVRVKSFILDLYLFCTR